MVLRGCPVHGDLAGSLVFQRIFSGGATCVRHCDLENDVARQRSLGRMRVDRAAFVIRMGQPNVDTLFAHIFL